jgi:hypothetical protein
VGHFRKTNNELGPGFNEKDSLVWGEKKVGYEFDKLQN